MSELEPQGAKTFHPAPVVVAGDRVDHVKVQREVI
jgi:hypothetical protein